MRQRDGDLKELLARFFDEQKAAEMYDDISAGDELIRNASNVEVDADVVSMIKQRGTARIRSYRRMSARWIAVRVAVAAVVAIVCFAAVDFVAHDQQSAIAISAGLWDIEDSHFASISSEVDEIETTIRAVRLGESYEQSPDVLELEVELNEIAGDIWGV